VHPIPVEIRWSGSPDGSGGLEYVTVKYDGVLVKRLGPQKTPFIADLGPYDASPSGGLAPGAHTVQIAARAEVDGGYSSRTLSFNVASGPSLQLSGRLRDLGGQTVFPGSYDVTVAGTDVLPGDPGQGVQRLELTVDGDVADAVEQPCDAGTCGDLDNTFWLNTEWLPKASHTVGVRAFDGEGNESDESWTIAADPIRTIFGLEPKASLSEIAQAASASGREWIEMQHSGVDEGGFELGDQSAEDGLQQYKDDYADEHGPSTEPEISQVTLGGSVEAGDLGALASKVVEREVVALPSGSDDHIDETVFDDGPAYPDELMAGDAAAEDQGYDDRPESLSLAASSSASAKAFAPSYGLVNTYNTFSGDTKKPRRISHTLTFPREAIGDTDGDGDKDESPFERAGAPDHGYEHDFKLIDPDYSGHSSHPACRNEKERFWARHRGRSWSTDFPAHSHPYFDTNLSDSCRYLDFTVGIKFPLDLTPKKTYHINIRARKGDQRYSRYQLSAEMTTRYCGGDPTYCSDSFDRQQLAGPRTDVRTMECRRWRKGYSSRRVCDYLD
jgi:hypothetical protein